MDKYVPVIGLEIHVELKTETGMFCQCKVNQFAAKPNTHVCPTCLGLPGALPVPNKKAIEWTIKIGKALNCRINKQSKFDRKHYSYPDLPKGYQISQYDEPIAVNGSVNIRVNGKNKSFRIQRVHLEEDTGKLIHFGNETLVDFNRSGTPLVEIVTEPDFQTPEEVKIFLEELHTIIRYLDVSDADMEKGTMRMEPNISLKKAGVKELPKYKVEVKNINSFRFVKQAIEYELERQIEILERGKLPEQETRGFDEKKVITYSQRSKEEAHDYRYFPEPDIPPMNFSSEYIESIKVPELPSEKVARYVGNLKIRENDAYILTRDIKTALYFEEVLKTVPQSIGAQFVANMIINKKLSTDLSIKDFVSKITQLSVPKKTDLNALNSAITDVIKNNYSVVNQYKSGKENAIMFLVGQVMRLMKGKADPKIVIEELKKRFQ